MSDVRHTWDGLQIAADDPRGSTVVVRRRRGSKTEYLLLHRAHHGRDFEGDWAWTSPAGARQPAEAVYPAALRELYEEAGLAGCSPWAIDLSGRWAVFGLDVPADARIELIDPEHDRFEWVDPEQAIAMVAPAHLGAATIARMREVPTMRWEFAPMSLTDLPALVRWRAQPHIQDWFGQPLTDVAHAERLYAARIRGESATRMWVARSNGMVVGYLQDYPVAAYDDYAVKLQDREAIGFDYMIGEPDLVDRGVGTAMIWSYLRDVLCRDFPDAPRFTASPDHRNARSLRALAKCGLVQGLWIDIPAGDDQPQATEIVCTLDRGKWFGASETSTRFGD